MSACEALRPLLFRVSEAEASPEEAMRVAQHVSGCTGCRILLARERRLAEILENELHDPLPVDEEFVDAVMATLPDGPPPRPSKRHLRLLKLASLGSAGCLAFLVLTQAWPAPYGGSLSIVPTAPALEGGGALFGSWLGLLRMALMILAVVSDTLPLARAFPAILLPTAALALLAGLVAATLGSLLCGVAAGTILGLGRRVRS